MKNGVWAIKNREKLWDSCGSGIFDDNLDAFKKCVVAVLKEQDPQFELPSEQRYAAAIHAKGYFVIAGDARIFVTSGSIMHNIHND